MTHTPQRLTVLPLLAFILGACAALATTSASAQSADPARERIAGYIREYRGGDCVFVRPRSVTGNAAVISGIGAAVAPFRQLDDAFKAAFGFEAMIEIMPIVPAQCPAVTFASRFRDTTDTPHLALKKMAFKRGEQITGTLRGLGDSNPTLLLVSESGRVDNVTAMLAGRGDSTTFSVTVSNAAVATRVPYVLVAVTGVPAPEASSPADGEDAERFFSRLAATNPRPVSDIQSFDVEP
jgi:serine/threonine-protein kinase